MLKPPTPTTAADETLVEYFPHLFLLHNQCKPSEFTPDHIKMMQVCVFFCFVFRFFVVGFFFSKINFMPFFQSVYRDSFIKSKLDIKSGVGVGMGGVIDFVDTESCGEPINLFLLPDTGKGKVINFIFISLISCLLLTCISFQMKKSLIGFVVTQVSAI